MAEVTSVTFASRLRSWLRMGLAATSACLGMGLLMFLLVSGPAAQVATAMIWTGLTVLVTIPVLNVIAVLLDEWSAQPRTFAVAAFVVLVLLGYTIVVRVI